MSRISGRKVSISASIYCATILEYTLAELLELSGRNAIHESLKAIQPYHIHYAIKNDDEIKYLFEEKEILFLDFSPKFYYNNFYGAFQNKFGLITFKEIDDNMNKFDLNHLIDSLLCCEIEEIGGAAGKEKRFLMI